jgi:addiction module HigA family antidote
MLKSKKVHKLPLLHPGENLRSVLEDAGLSANAVALALRVPANRLTEILNGRRAITADTAMRLGRYFGTSAQMWMNLQARYDLEAAEEKLAERIEQEVQPMRRAS